MGCRATRCAVRSGIRTNYELASPVKKTCVARRAIAQVAGETMVATAAKILHFDWESAQQLSLSVL